MSFKTAIFDMKDKNVFIKNAEETRAKITLKNVKAIKGRNMGKALIGVTFNKEENRFMGFKKLSAREKEAVGFHIDENSTFELYDGKELDLSVENTYKYWMMIKYSPMVAFSEKEAKEHDAMFYVYSAEADSKLKNDKEELEYTAKGHIFNDDPANYHMRAKLLGYDMEGSSSGEVKQTLLGVAKTDPAKIAAIYNAKTISTKIMVMKGINSGKIAKDGETFVYDNIVLGITTDGVVSFLEKKENKNVLEVMRNDIDNIVVEVPKEITSKPINNMTKVELLELINSDDFEFKGVFSGDVTTLTHPELKKVANGKEV